MSMRDLGAMFNPRSIAIIGASEHPQKVGAIILKNIILSGYKGEIFPVNPRVANIGGFKFWNDVASLPKVPDLAVIAIPAEKVLEVMEQIVVKGIKNVVLVSAGFKESGDEGKNREKQLKEIVVKNGINLLGPNCLGFANNGIPLNCTFSQVVTKGGNLRIASQSGALASSLFDWCKTTDLGFDQLVTLGNKTDINENDILEYWLKQPVAVDDLESGLSGVMPIGLYLESIVEGNKFLDLAKKITVNNPMFVLKPGRSQAAAEAMRSHTGSIAGEDDVMDQAFREANIIRCQELGDFLDLAKGFSWENVPLGNKVAIISNAGGMAVLSADAVKKEGLELSQLSDQAQEQLKEYLPRINNLVNPVDILGDALADNFGKALEVVLAEKSVDMAMVILTPQLMTQIDQTAIKIGEMGKKFDKPIFVSFVGGGVTETGVKILNQYKIPNFSFPERALRVMVEMCRWQAGREKIVDSMVGTEKTEFTETEKIKQVLADAGDEMALDNIGSNELMRVLGINVPMSRQVKDVVEADEFAAMAGRPVVLKMSSPKLLHKSDVGGVITGLYDQSQIKMAWQDLAKKMENLKDASQVKVQVQKEILGGVEAIVGVRRDPTFGMVMLFGAGGQLAEMLEDKNLKLLPLGKNGAQILVESSKIWPLFNGYRGREKYDLVSLYELMKKMEMLMEEFPEIKEIEINPVKITEDKIWAIDAKVLLAK